MQRLRNSMGGTTGVAFALVGFMVLSFLVTSAVEQPPARAAAGTVAAATRSATVVAQADPGTDLYTTHCAGCHQAGGEGIVGTFPPLAGNPAATDAAHVETVIREGLTGPLEVLGQSYDSAMPAVSTLSDDEVAAVVAHVIELAGGEGGAGEPTVAPPPPEAPAAGDVDRGHDLFIGSTRLDNGGGACAGCHAAGSVGSLGGSTLGPDLTGAYARLGGEAGLTAWLGNPPSPTMTPIFAAKPLSAAEIADVVAFLADAPDQAPASDDVDRLLLAGVGGLVILIAGMAIVWRGMRQTYVQRLRSAR